MIHSGRVWYCTAWTDAVQKAALMRGRRAKQATRQRRKTVAYVRVSTEEQARDGVSLAAQESRIEAFAHATDRSIDEVVVDDGFSAKSLKRPGAERLLTGIRSGEIGTVIVLKLDRLTRSVRDLGLVLDLVSNAEASLVSVGESLDTQTAAGRMVVNMLGVVAQWEREAIAERTALALSHKRSNWEVYSRKAPFGYKVVGRRLVSESRCQEALTLIRTMYADGAGSSLRQIAGALTQRGIKPPAGKKWYASSVHAIVRSKMYKERPLP